MQNKNDKIGIFVSVAVTVLALSFLAITDSIQSGSIQSQGELIINRTSNELQNMPDKMREMTSNTLNNAEDMTNEIPAVADGIIEKSNSVSDMAENTANAIEDVLPDVPQVVEQTDGHLLKLVSIPSNTGMPGCETSDSCFIPDRVVMSVGSEVIWTNDDSIAHTITSGNPENGPNGLFDSGLIMPGDSYSLTFNIPFEYDYFCMVHPWMQGTVAVR